MLRREVACRSESGPVVAAARSVLFVGPMGRGVGLAADILADAARLAHRRVIRRRSVSTAAESHPSPTGTLTQLVCMHVPGSGSKPAKQNFAESESSLAAQATAVAESVDVVVAWDREAAASRELDVGPTTEVIVLDDGVPQWRAGWNAAGAPPRAAAACMAARALGRLSLRLPFTAELWRRTIALHVPARFAETVVGQFDAAQS